ncbi:MAG: efflux transporter outer membrane subunit [Bryobacteraceae bacterium]
MTRAAATLCLLTAVLALAGCMVGPKYSKPAVPTAPADQGQLPSEFKEASGWKQAQPDQGTLPQGWWQVFGNPELNDLEAQVDVSNQTIQAAEAQFRQARALVGLSRAGLYPTISANPGIATNRNSSTVATATPGLGEYSSFVLPFDVSYELDAWGRIRRSIAAARAEMQATAADLATVRLSLHAELAIDYFELRSLDAQKQLLERTLVAYQKALDLNQNRFQGGLSSGSEVAQARTQLETARAQSIDVDAARAQFAHAIAILAGRTPESLSLAVAPLASTPPVIPTGIPSQLLERRPDIAAAERRMAEANERIGIARAAFYPTLQITAAGGFQGGSIVDWFTWPSRFWALGPSALQTLFDAGRRRAANEAATAGYDATVADYRQSALNAFRDVEDTLATLRVLEQESAAQRVAVEAAQHSLELSMNRYAGGLVTYLEVVTAQSTALANERVEVDLLRRRMDACVLLIKALGGGWDVSKLPS